ncbi:hypothetical protein BN990_02238 [Virgibacillus salexigens]|uniref:Uncharacterized protein n=1 Tax=Virgibacillus massiliensis TaxID=1462526 RepID=A0A024QD97_9BACI|nr:hypothetical protein BN990_02238 [Virgibacillus massiliensis]
MKDKLLLVGPCPTYKLLSLKVLIKTTAFFLTAVLHISLI